MNEVSVREPSHEEFLKVAQISFKNFVNETAKSTGESPFFLKEKLGGSLTKIWDNDIWLLIEKDKKQVGFVYLFDMYVWGRPPEFSPLRTWFLILVWMS